MTAEHKKEPKETTTRVAVYFQAPSGIDQELLARVMKEIGAAKNMSVFLKSLILRGWVSMLHGTTKNERILQMRSLGLTEQLIEDITALIPRPNEVNSSFTAGVDVTPADQTDRMTPGIQPTPDRQEPAFFVPRDSRLGTIGPGGGLA